MIWWFTPNRFGVWWDDFSVNGAQFSSPNTKKGSIISIKILLQNMRIPVATPNTKFWSLVSRLDTLLEPGLGHIGVPRLSKIIGLGYRPRFRSILGRYWAEMRTSAVFGTRIRGEISERIVLRCFWLTRGRRCKASPRCFEAKPGLLFQDPRRFEVSTRQIFLTQLVSYLFVPSSSQYSGLCQAPGLQVQFSCCSNIIRRHLSSS